MTTLGGLPAHVLLVHAVVVLVPLSALLVLLVGVWPAARRRWAVPAAVLAVVAAVAVPLATESGEWLEHRVESTALLRTTPRSATRCCRGRSRWPWSRWRSGLES